jgi:3-oxoacyl-[acyl-carrier protein] reductase
MAAVWAPFNIRVNAILPAAKSEMYEEAQRGRTEEQLVQVREWKKRVILLGGDLSSVDEVPPTIIYLMSDAAKFVTGQLLAINGGMGFLR